MGQNSAEWNNGKKSSTLMDLRKVDRLSLYGKFTKKKKILQIRYKFLIYL